MTTPRARVVLGRVVLAGSLAAGLAACTGDGSRPSSPSSPSAEASGGTSGPEETATELLTDGAEAAGSTGATGETTDPDDPAYDVALSEPVEDSLYPDVGEPDVDALHHSLDLTWEPTTDTLTGRQTLVFRAARAGEDFQLDLAETLEVGTATLDGEPVEVEHTGKDLVVLAPVEADERHVLSLTYAGTPEPVKAPSKRADFEGGLGLTIDDEHQLWTMQEPYGAFTWYAVNDQPSDKALYDFTLRVPSPWVGVANGRLVSDEDDGTTRTTVFDLDEPAAPYLTTLAFGDYEKTEDVGPRGLPLTYWTPRGWAVAKGLRTSPAAIRWLEEKLGPYPFATGGIVLVDSESGMETQTMITLGTTEYATSPEVVLHEFAHQWWGDEVTPSDWRDLWMNEGMAMYLQLWWQADQAGTPLDAYLRQEGWVGYERQLRRESGPPGESRADDFGASNVYVGGAFFWHALRRTMDDDARFLRVIRAWPRTQSGRSTDREALLAFLERRTGVEVEPLMDAWIEGRRSPRLPR